MGKCQKAWIIITFEVWVEMWPDLPLHPDTLGYYQKLRTKGHPPLGVACKYRLQIALVYNCQWIKSFHWAGGLVWGCTVACHSDCCIPPCKRLFRSRYDTGKITTPFHILSSLPSSCFFYQTCRSGSWGHSHHRHRQEVNFSGRTEFPRCKD